MKNLIKNLRLSHKFSSFPQDLTFFSSPMANSQGSVFFGGVDSLVFSPKWQKPSSGQKRHRQLKLAQLQLIYLNRVMFHSYISFTLVYKMIDIIYIYISQHFFRRSQSNDLKNRGAGPVKKSCSKTRIPCSCDDPGWKIKNRCAALCRNSM